MQFENAPTQFPEDRPFWEAARDGQLLLKWCLACHKPHFYPRPHCPLCGHRETQWRQSSGRGRIYSFTLSNVAGRLMAPAVVELEEGIRITTVITDADVRALAIGDKVQVAFGKGPGEVPVLAFTTQAAEQARTYAAHALQACERVAGLSTDAPAPRLDVAAVVGAGRMGQGITLALLAAGLHVLLIDQSEEVLVRACQFIEAELGQLVVKGRLSDADRLQRLAALRTGTDMAVLAQADIVVEAVWEQLALKQELFRQIDRYARLDAVLGTNTSTLDIDMIAGVTGRPESVVGLHFFSPAHVMKLVEVVRGPRTGVAALAAAQTLARRMSKVAVVVGVCHGFVGNRLMMAREAEAGRLLLEGSSPEQVDRVLREFGLPMGTFELQDMTGGIEINYRRRQESGEENWLVDRLFEAGRGGQRVGKGYYRYEAGKRQPIVDAEVMALIEEASRISGIARRKISDQEVLERLIYPMINEGAKLVEEGIVERASDIDVVWRYGYGWPTWKGGPMYYADQLGPEVVNRRLQELCAQYGSFFQPAALLQHLAASGRSFTS